MYFINQHKIRSIVRNILINKFNVSPNQANEAAKLASLEPVPRWLLWLRIQKLKFNNLIHFGEFSLK